MLMFTREGSSCNNSRLLTGDMQQAKSLHGTWWESLHCIFQSDTHHYYQRLVNWKLSLHVYRPRRLKTFEAVVWLPPIARKPRTNEWFIANALLFSVVGNARLVLCDGQLSLEHPSGTKFVNLPQVQHFHDKRDKSLIRWSSPAVFHQIW